MFRLQPTITEEEARSFFDNLLEEGAALDDAQVGKHECYLTDWSA